MLSGSVLGLPATLWRLSLHLAYVCRSAVSIKDHVNPNSQCHFSLLIMWAMPNTLVFCLIYLFEIPSFRETFIKPLFKARWSSLNLRTGRLECSRHVTGRTHWMKNLVKTYQIKYHHFIWPVKHIPLRRTYIYLISNKLGIDLMSSRSFQISQQLKLFLETKINFSISLFALQWRHRSINFERSFLGLRRLL